MELKRATRYQEKLRIGLSGPSGSGKTYSALNLAHGLIGDWSIVAIIDTEHGSGNLYADLGEYNHLPLLPPFTPERYIEAINICLSAGMEAIIIDSISHEWEGQGGILEISNSMTGNSFTNWGKLTPRHNKFIDRILSAPAHMICCLRTKTEYTMSKETNWKGKEVDVPKKIGLKANTREGFDYEMTVSFDIEHKTHYAMTSKDRTRIFDSMHEVVLGAEHGKLLIDWVNAGVKEPEPVVLPEEPKTDDAKEALKLAINTERARHKLKWPGVYEIAKKELTAESTVEDLQEVLNALLNYAA